MNNIYYIMGLAAMTLGPGRESLWFAGWLDLMQLLCCAVLCCVVVGVVSQCFIHFFFFVHVIFVAAVCSRTTTIKFYSKGANWSMETSVLEKVLLFFMALCIYPLEHQSVPTCSPTSHTRTVENRVWSEKVVPFDCIRYFSPKRTELQYILDTIDSAC